MDCNNNQVNFVIVRLRLEYSQETFFNEIRVYLTNTRYKRGQTFLYFNGSVFPFISRLPYNIQQEFSDQSFRKPKRNEGLSSQNKLTRAKLYFYTRIVELK